MTTSLGLIDSTSPRYRRVRVLARGLNDQRILNLQMDRQDRSFIVSLFVAVLCGIVGIVSEPETAVSVSHSRISTLRLFRERRKIFSGRPVINS